MSAPACARALPGASGLSHTLGARARTRAGAGQPGVTSPQGIRP
jgi:hypothetical protein